MESGSNTGSRRGSRVRARIEAMSTWTRWRSLTVVLATVAVTSVASAQGERTVVVVFPADAPWTERMQHALQAQTQDMGVRMVVVADSGSAELGPRMDRAARLAKEHGAAGTFFFDREEERKLSVSVFEPEGARIAVRQVPLVKTAEGAATEALATIVRSTIDGFLEKKNPPPAPTATPTPTATATPTATLTPAPVTEPRDPAPKPPARTAHRHSPLRVAAYYDGNSFSRQVPWQSGARIDAYWVPTENLYVGAGYLYYPTVNVGSDIATIALSRHVGELVAGGEFRFSRFSAGGELGLLVDSTSRATRVTVRGLTATPDSSSLTPGGKAHIHGAWHWLPSSRLVLGAGIDVFPAASAYVAEFPGAMTLLSPRTVRPRVDAGVSFDFP